MRYSEVTYGDYVYPDWAAGIGWIMTMAVVAGIIVTAIVQMILQCMKGEVWQFDFLFICIFIMFNSFLTVLNSLSMYVGRKFDYFAIMCICRVHVFCTIIGVNVQYLLFFIFCVF